MYKVHFHFEVPLTVTETIWSYFYPYAFKKPMESIQTDSFVKIYR